MRAPAKDALKKLAAEARLAFEADNIAPVLLEDLYTHYNPEVKDVAGFIKKASGLFPTANCGITSLYLQHKLKAGEIINGTYGSNGHTFLLIDTLVVDITADQFGGPSVYVGSLEKPWASAK